MSLAYIIDNSGYISVAVFEDGEYWTGSYQHDMTKVRVATLEELEAFNSERKRALAAADAYKAQFGITDFSRNGPKIQPEQYAAMLASDRQDPKAFSKFVENFKIGN
jgi:hypothetical protein